MEAYHNQYRHLITSYDWYKACEEKMRFGSVVEKAKVLTIESAIENLRIS